MQATYELEAMPKVDLRITDQRNAETVGFAAFITRA
jgi:hypothetical protein